MAILKGIFSRKAKFSTYPAIAVNRAPPGRYKKTTRVVRHFYKKHRTPINLAATAAAMYATGGTAALRGAAVRYAAGTRAGRAAMYLANRPASAGFRRLVVGNITKARAARAAAINRGRAQYVRAMWPRHLYPVGRTRMYRMRAIRQYAGYR